MKTIITSIAMVCAAAFLFAQDAGAQERTSDYAGLLSGAQLKGAEVMNLQNQEIGSIEEVLVDPSTGRIRFAVLSVGGFLGLGDTEVAVPWSAVQVSKSGDTAKFVVDATKERLEKAPRVEGKTYDRLYTRQDAEPTFVYWGVTWYDVGVAASPRPGNVSTCNELAHGYCFADELTVANGWQALVLIPTPHRGRRRDADVGRSGALPCASQHICGANRNSPRSAQPIASTSGPLSTCGLWRSWSRTLRCANASSASPKRSSSARGA